MRKLIGIFILIIIIFLGFYIFQKNSNSHSNPKKEISQRAASTENLVQENPGSILFVPYWTLEAQGDTSEFDTLAYFGIEASTSGISKDEPGYKNIEKFSIFAQEKSTALVLRMLNTDTANIILKDKTFRKNLITETLSIAKDYGFSEVVVDLEYSALPFESVVSSITNFYKEFETESHKNNLKLSALIYGDVFMRARPYDIPAISKSVDQIYVMAYDFHKARGNPGPNYPLRGKEKYGYDFKTMIEDFLKAVPINKVSVIFGLYGYDWTVDEKNQSIGLANSKSTYFYKDRYLKECKFTSCKVERDEVSAETEITYVDQDGKKHIIWFEDEKSMEEKKKYLDTLGVKAFGVWAYSYY